MPKDFLKLPRKAEQVKTTAAGGSKKSAFDVMKVKKHHKVLGRKDQRQESATGELRGTAAAVNRRRTLLMDMKKAKTGNANMLVDLRPAAVVEGSGSISTNEKLLLRWHRERQSSLIKQNKKKAKYALDDDDEGSAAAVGGHLGEVQELTHGGKKFHDESVLMDMPEGAEDDWGGPVDNADEDADAAMMGQAQFGGDLVGEDGRPRTTQEVYEEVIAKSKMRKAEKAKDRDMTTKMVQDLDANFSNLIGLINANKRSEMNPDDDVIEEEVPEEAGEAEFEGLVKTMAMEGKARASDRTKKPEEIALEKKQALEKLEKERLKRMNGNADGDNDEDENLDTEGGKEGDEAAEEKALKALRKATKSEATTAAAAAAATTAGSAAVDSMPYAISIPASKEEWQTMASKWTAEDREIGVQRILACNHPSLDPQNTPKLVSFLQILLETLGDPVPVKMPSAVEDLDPQARAISCLCRELGGKHIAPLFIDRLHQAYEQSAGSSIWPSPRDLVLIKLISEVFPPSDYRHVVTTPAMILSASCLSRSSCSSRADLVSALFLCSSVPHFIADTAKVVPEALNFVSDLLKPTNKWVAEVMKPPKEQFGKVVMMMPLPTDLAAIEEMSQDEFAVAAMNVTLACLLSFVKLWIYRPRGKLLLAPTMRSLELIQSSWIDTCSCLAPLFKEIKVAFYGQDQEEEEEKKEEQEEEVGEPKNKFPKFTVLERKNPMPIREFNPKIVEAKIKAKKENEEEDEATKRERVKKLKRSVDRQRKAVAREIRKDSAFVSAQRDEEMLRENEEIKAKAGQIKHLFQNDAHEAKVEKREEEAAHRKLRM